MLCEAMNLLGIMPLLLRLPCILGLLNLKFVHELAINTRSWINSDKGYQKKNDKHVDVQNFNSHSRPMFVARRVHIIQIKQFTTC